MISRRRFLGLGAAALTAVFIPRDHLDFGAPAQKILTLPPPVIEVPPPGLTLANLESLMEVMPSTPTLYMNPTTYRKARLALDLTGIDNIKVIGGESLIDRFHVVRGKQLSDLFFDTDYVADPHPDAMLGMRRRIMGFDESGGTSSIYAVDFGPETAPPSGRFGFESYYGMQIPHPRSGVRLRGVREDSAPIPVKDDDGQWKQRGMDALKRLDAIQSDMRSRV